MGKRKRSKSKSEKGAKKLHKNVGSTSDAPSVKPSHSEKDIDENCVMYESPDEEKPVVDNNEESDASESSADALELAARDGEKVQSEVDSDIEVTFDFYDPRESDEQAIATFLSDLCTSVRPKASEDKGSLDHRAVSKAVCAQSRVGTVIKITDDSQPIGFVSVLAVQQHRDLLTPLASCLRKAGAPASLLRSFVEPKEGEPLGSRLGLILTGRVVNLPPQLTPKMFEAFLDEVKWATEDEPTPELRKSFDLHWYLYITDVYPVTASAPLEKKKKSPKKKSRGKPPSTETKTKDEKDEQIGFTRIEDEILHNTATHAVSWKIPGEEAGPEGLIRRKMAMFIKKAKMDEAFASIKKLFGVEDEQPEDDEESSKLNK